MSNTTVVSRIIDELLAGLVKRNVLSQFQVAEIEEKGFVRQSDLEQELMGTYGVKMEGVLLVLADYARIPALKLEGFNPDPAVTELVPVSVMKAERVYPIAKTESTLTLAVADPLNIMAVQEVSDMTRLRVLPVVALETEILDLVVRADSAGGQDINDILKEAGDANIEFESQDDENIDISAMTESADEVPVIRIVNMVLMEALRKGASDIHIEPFDKTVRLRYRIDGTLFEGTAPPKSLQNAMTSRIKVMSQLDIAERRIPQDGRFRIKAQGREIDLRVSILPTVHGEKTCMRILDKGNLKAGLDDLGLDPSDLKRLKDAVAHPHGLILVTGPTGSGKTTTLYSCLQELNTVDVNIVTVENPVEYQLDGINQVEINDAVGMTFSSALRSILRQDPDVVLVGETRDAETANIAIKAALTGHLVMTNLHTNDAPTAVTRLGDMGIERFLLASALILAQAQRLIKTVCGNCKEKFIYTEEECRELELPWDMFKDKEVVRGKGCSRCGGTGYKGRASIMEVLQLTPPIREQIMKGANADDIRAYAIEHEGFKTLRDAGYRRIIEGMTTVDEVVRVTAAE